MSDDEDNVVCFTKALNETRPYKVLTIQERVISCMMNPECKCMYCVYKKTAAQMVVDFLARDVVTFEKNSGAKFCTYDLKDILFQSIHEIKDMEKEE